MAEALQQESTDDPVLKTTLESVISRIEKEGRGQFDGASRSGGVFLHDGSGILVDVDEAACRSLGAERGELIGTNMSEIDLDFPKPFIRELWQARGCETSFMRYGRLRRRDSSHLSVQMDVFAVLLDGEWLFVLRARAISDQERIEAALVQSENQLRAVFDAEPECVKLVSRDGILLEMNPAGLAMVEADRPEEAIGQEISMLVHEEDRSIFEEVNRGAFEGRSGVAEFRITGLKGTKRWMETHVSPLRDSDGEVIAALSITREVTERKESDELLLKLLEGTAGSVGSDFFRGLVKAIAEIFGVDFVFVGELKKPLRTDEMDMAKVVTVCCWVDGCFGEAFEYQLLDTPCRTVFNDELCHYETGVADLFPKDEMLREIGADSYLGVPLKSESGSVIGVLVVMDRKPMPHDERTKTVFRIFGARASSELNRVIIRRHEEELERQLQQVQRMESIGTLAGGIAHDFNNIVCAILANAELAMLDLNSDHPAFESVEGIVKSTKRASSLIAQIMMFSRHKTPVRVPVSLAGTVTEAGTMMRSLIPATVEMEFRIDRALPSVLADQDQIHQVVVNLCTNAWHALGSHPGKIRVGLKSVEVSGDRGANDVPLREGTYVVLEVSDNGHGMDPETQRRIYDPFFTTKAAGQGIGLGLSVVHGIVDVHDGKIVLTSKVGLGSTFSIYLPVVDHGVKSTEQTSVGLTDGEGCRVLCIDDESAIIDVMERALGRLNYQVTGIMDPELAVQRFKAAQNDFDIVIVDYFMPKMTGLDVIRKIRECRRDIPIVLSSGNIDESIRRAARSDGVREFLDKPYSSESMSTILRQALQPSSSIEA